MLDNMYTRGRHMICHTEREEIIWYVTHGKKKCDMWGLILPISLARPNDQLKHAETTQEWKQLINIFKNIKYIFSPKCECSDISAEIVNFDLQLNSLNLKSLWTLARTFLAIIFKFEKTNHTTTSPPRISRNFWNSYNICLSVMRRLK